MGSIRVDDMNSEESLARAQAAAPSSEHVSFYLSYRKPFDFGQLLAFFKTRELSGVELIDDVSYTRAVRLQGVGADGGDLAGWVRVSDEPAESRLAVNVSASLKPALSQVEARLHQQFDIDCDPQAVHEGIRQLDELVPGAAVLGTRVPGAFDPFEISVRAILGQQISVRAANKLAARIVQAYGTAIETDIPGLTHLFPTASDLLALDPIEDALGQLGVVRTRSRVIAELARLVTEGQLDLSPAASAPEQMERLLAVKGIGPWSANYIAMRALHYPDAFLETDIGVKHALPQLTPAQRLHAAEAWRPWRAYANVCLWNSLG